MFGPIIDGPLIGLLGLLAVCALFWRKIKAVLHGGARGMTMIGLALISAAGSAFGIYAYQIDSNPFVAVALGALFGSFIGIALLQDTWLKKLPFIAMSIVSGTVMTSAALLNPIEQGAQNAAAGREVAALTVGAATALKSSLENAQRAQQGFIADANTARAQIADIEKALREDHAATKVGAELALLDEISREPAAGSAEHSAWRGKVMEFQNGAGLRPDGLLGANTRAAVQRERLQAQKRYDRMITAIEEQRDRAQSRMNDALAREKEAASRVAAIQAQMGQATTTALATAGTQTDRRFAANIGAQWEFVFSLSPFDRQATITIFAFLIMALVDIGCNWLSLPYRLRAVNDNPAPARQSGDEATVEPSFAEDALRRARAGVAALTAKATRPAPEPEQRSLRPSLPMKPPQEPVFASATPPLSALQEIGAYRQRREVLERVAEAGAREQGHRQPHSVRAARKAKRVG